MDLLAHELQRVQLSDKKPRCASLVFQFEGDAETRISAVSFDCTAWSLRSVLTFYVNHKKGGVWCGGKRDRWSLVQTRIVDLLIACGARVVFVWGEEQAQVVKRLPGVCCDLVDLASFGFSLNTYLRPCDGGCICGGLCATTRGMLNWFLNA